MSFVLAVPMYAACNTKRERATLAHIALAIALLLLSACGRAPRKISTHTPAPPRPARIGETETGTASWYGNPYHGRATASGEIYDMMMFTAAHRTLPFQTWLDVTNLSNGKHVEVRVTDRGPFVDGRVIDLSLAAAREIDMVRTGTARVRLKVITPPKDVAKRELPPKKIPAPDPVPSEAAPMTLPDSSPIARYSVQAGAFADHDRAESLRSTLADQLGAAWAVRLTGPAGTPALWRVVVGQALSFEDATALAPKVRSVAGAALVVPDRKTGSDLP